MALKTEQSTVNEYEEMNSASDQINEILSGINRPEKFATDGSFNAEKGVNTPKLASNMKLITFDTESNS